MPNNEFTTSQCGTDSQQHQNLGASTNVFELARGNIKAAQSESQDTERGKYNFKLSEERYLEGLDTRCIIKFDEEKFVACVWG